MEGIKKWIFTLVASIPGLFIELQWLIFVVLFGFLFDCLTAYGLNRRMKRKGLSTGKFSSNKFFKMIVRFTFCAGGIIFCYFIDRFVPDDIQSLHLANWLTLLICLVRPFPSRKTSQRKMMTAWQFSFRRYPSRRRNAIWKLTLIMTGKSATGILLRKRTSIAE